MKILPFKTIIRRTLIDLQAIWNYVKVVFVIYFQRDSFLKIMVPNAGINNVIYIDPNKIEYYGSVAVKPKKGNKFFIDGDWDLSKTRLAEEELHNPKYVSCRQILLENINCEATAEYLQITGIINQGGSYRGCRSRQDVVDYVEGVARTCRNIRDRGYLSQAQLGNSRYVGEMECALDRDGNLMKINAGNHRFAAARILGLKSVPVLLCFVHGNHAGHFHSLSAVAGLDNLNAFIRAVEQRYS